MRPWLPVPGTTTGRLVAAALEEFGAHGFAPVSVAAIAKRAGVTTGALYHHFGSKTGLWNLVRGDVEQRVLDRVEGAAAVHPVTSIADLAPAILAGFDHLVRTEHTRLLAEPPNPDAGEDDPVDDRIGDTVDRLLEGTGAPVGALVAAAWRAALDAASRGDAAAARAGLERLLRG
jgi:AcrR family transcriptional regulator